MNARWAPRRLRRVGGTVGSLAHEAEWARRAGPVRRRTMSRMVLASLGSDLVTTGGMVVVLGMAAMLIYRGSRSRSQDREDDQES